MTLEDALTNLQSEDAAQRTKAIQHLETVAGADPGVIMPALIAALQDTDDSVKLAALKALGARLPAHPAFVMDAARVMVLLLVRPTGTLVKTAVIHVIYETAKPYMAVLQPLMKDADAEVQAGATNAFLKIYPPSDGFEGVIPKPVELQTIPFAELDLTQFMDLLGQLQTVDATQEVEIVQPEPDFAEAEPAFDLDDWLSAPEEPERAKEEQAKATGETPIPQAPPAPVPAMPTPSMPVPAPSQMPAPNEDGEVLTPPPRQRAVPAVELPAPQAPPASRPVPKPVEASAPRGAAPRNEEVQFSAYYPREIEPQKWQPMTAYVYKAFAAPQIVQDAQQQLGGLIATMRRIIQRARQTIPTGTTITATPYLEGFQFNPPQAVVGFYEDWHRFDFKLRAVDAPLNMAANGRLSFTVEGIIVAEIPLSIYVGDAVSASSMVTMSQKLYKSIFCSYSRDDTFIVDRVERVYKALGFDFLRDVHTIKSGEDWNEKLYDMIEKADIFQLFWSKTAAESEWVEKEWRYALLLDRDESNFIRPVYWEEPIPPVPNELNHIHFAFEPTLDD